MVQKKRHKEHRSAKKRNLEAGILATLILLVFRIPLANIIGNEGNGYLAVSWEIYNFFYLLFGYGFSKGISQMVKKRIEKKLYINSKKSMKIIFSTGLILSLAGGALLYFGAAWIAGLFPEARMVEISLKLGSPLLVCQTMLGILRGYFEGMGTKVPTDISRLVEAVITATGALLFVFVTAGYGEKVSALLHNEHFTAGFAAAGVVFGYLCGTLLSLLFLSFVYVLYSKGYNRLLKKDLTRVPEAGSGLFLELFSSFPAILGQILFLKFYRLVNLYLYGRQLSAEEVTSGIDIIGSFYGKITVLMALAVALILFFSEKKKKRDRKQLIQHEAKAGRLLFAEELQKLFFLAAPAMGSFIALSEALLKTLYTSGSQAESLLLGIGGVSLVFISLGMYLYRILLSQHLHKQLFFVQTTAFVLQLLFMLLITKLPPLGNFSLLNLSLGIAELVFWIVFSLGQLAVLMKIYRLRFPWGNIFLVPLIRAAIMTVVQVVIVQLLKQLLPSGMVCILAIGLGIVFYWLSGRVSILKTE